MALYKIETNSHFTFLQGITKNVGNIITINKNLFATYNMTKKKNRETEVISGVVAPKEKTLEVKPP